MINVFFSYSHRDETLRDELEVHFAQMKREGLISGWHDRRIGAGQEFVGEINEQLEKADVILLLVSPYFLDSAYCYDVEMTRALERHAKREARVIPVILTPCDWHSAPFGKLLAVPTDGRAITKYPNQHDAFLEVVKAVRQVANDIGRGQVPASQLTSRTSATSPAQPVGRRLRSSNLRTTKEFSDHDRDVFLEETFEVLANFFEGSLTELELRNPGVTTKFRRVDANHFTATIYKHGATASQCKIWLSIRGSFGGNLMYSGDLSDHDNSFNESLTLDEDGHALFLSPMAMASFGRDRDCLLTQEGAAEYFWTLFIEPLQRPRR